MKPTRIACLAAAALLASGCATHRYCMGEQDYQRAVSIPPLEGSGELQMPVSPTALVIPDPPPGGKPYGRIETTPEGKERAVCLDRPPALPPLKLPDAASDAGQS